MNINKIVTISNSFFDPKKVVIFILLALALSFILVFTIYYFSEEKMDLIYGLLIILLFLIIIPYFFKNLIYKKTRINGYVVLDNLKITIVKSATQQISIEWSDISKYYVTNLKTSLFTKYFVLEIHKKFGKKVIIPVIADKILNSDDKIETKSLLAMFCLFVNKHNKEYETKILLAQHQNSIRVKKHFLLILITLIVFYIYYIQKINLKELVISIFIVLGFFFYVLTKKQINTSLYNALLKIHNSNITDN